MLPRAATAVRRRRGGMRRIPPDPDLGLHLALHLQALGRTWYSQDDTRVPRVLLGKQTQGVFPRKQPQDFPGACPVLAVPVHLQTRGRTLHDLRGVVLDTVHVELDLVVHLRPHAAAHPAQEEVSDAADDLGEISGLLDLRVQRRGVSAL